MATIACRLTTPERKIMDEPIVSATIPAWDGEIGILPNHSPIVAKLGLGELRIQVADSDKSRGGSRAFVVDGGFLQVVNNKMSILAEKAWPAENLNETDAKAELAELEARRIPDDAENRDKQLADLKRARERAATKLRVARKYQGRGI